jgi:uncharacterized protein YbjT (DUF2867 family)
MNLVVGATGYLGSEICRRLAARGKPVRAMVRSASAPEKVESLRRLGAEIALGDLKDRPSLDAACQGVRAVISTASTTISRQPGDSLESVDRQGQIGLVNAASAAGVSHFVLVSVSGSFQIDCPLLTAKRAVEQRLRESGMTYTILRPTTFMDVWLSPILGFDYVQAKATVYGTGHARTSYIALGDVAQFAVESLDNPAARNAILELGGPEALSQHEVIGIFEEKMGRPFEVQPVPADALEAQYAGATDSLQKSFAALMLSRAQGDVIPMAETLRAFPLNLTSVADYAERVTTA